MRGAPRSLSLLADREFLALSSSAFARSQAYSTILIALALYADLFGTTGVVEGLFGTAFAAAQLFIVLPLGRAVDAGDARRYLLGGLVLNVAVFVGFAFVDSAVHVVLMRILQGAGASVLWIAGTAVVGEISPGTERGRWLGTYNQVGAFSSLAGDLVGGYLLYAHGFTLTYAILSGVTVLAFLLVLAFLRENPGGDDTQGSGLDAVRALLDRPMIQSLVAFRLLFGVGKMAVIVFLPIYARKGFGVSALAIGGILAGGKLTKALTQGWFGDLTDRLGHKEYFVAAGAALYAVGAASVVLAAPAEAAFGPVTLSGLGRTVVLTPAVVVLFLVYSLLGVADSVRIPASMALFVEEGEPHDAVAASFSLRSLSWKAGHLAGPLAAGAAKDAYGTPAAFVVAAGFVVAGTAVFLALRGRARAAPAPAPGD